MTAPVRTRGWFRRNIWGLILILPLAAGLFAFNYDILYTRNYTLQAKEPVPLDGTGLATLDDYQLRVVELAPVENEIELNEMVGLGQPLPGTVKIWRLILTVRANEPIRDSFVASCRISIEDADGRRFQSAPNELRNAPGASTGSACYADDDEQPLPYTATALFLLPAEARPTSVIVTWSERLPRYIRFAVAP